MSTVRNQNQGKRKRPAEKKSPAGSRNAVPSKGAAVKKPKLENGGAPVPAKVDRAAGLQKTAQMVKTQQAKSPSKPQHKPLKKNEKEKKSKDEEEDEMVAKEENDSEEEEGDFVDFGEEEDDEDDKVGEEDGGHRGKKGKAAVEKKLRPYAAPTFEEIKRLKETEELFKSNLFRLQITELLSEVRVNYDKTVVIQHLLRKLYEVVQNVPEQEVTWETTKDAPLVKAVPISESEAQKLKFKFAPPEDVLVLGSYLLRTVAKPVLNIDVGIELPKGLVRKEKDVLNHRYGYKRAAYLHLLAKELQKDKRFAEVKWTGFRDDVEKPILTIKPKTIAGDEYAKAKTEFVIRIIPFIPPTAFKLDRLLPNKSNIHEASADADDETKAGQAEAATPHYNNAIVEDMLYQTHQKLIHEQLQNSPAIVDAILLFKIWLRQRSMHVGADTMNGFLASMLLLHLLQLRKVNREMSSYQIFRAALDFIVRTDFTAGVAMKCENEALSGADHVALFTSKHELTFIDNSGRLNLFARMTKNAYEELRYEAQQTMKFFGNEVVDGFDSVFISPVDFWLKFDNYIHVTLPEEAEDEERARDLSWETWLARRTAQVLARGLSDRVTLLRTRALVLDQYELDHAPTELGRQVIVGLILNPETAQRLVDLGPPADDTAKAAEFRQFWGPKSEMRRFKDGKINESVVWSPEGGARYAIVREAANYLLNRHLNISSSSIRAVIDQFDGLLSHRGKAKIVDTSPTIITAFDQLCVQLRTLGEEYLPLGIVALYQVSAAFRMTEVYPQQPINKTRPNHLGLTCVDPIVVAIQLEPSAAWPDDLAAIRKLKAAFYIKVAEGLRKKHGHVCTPTPQWVDVQLKREGFVFRFFIHQQKEIALMAKAEEAVDDKAALPERVLQAAQHAGRMHGFSHRHTSYPMATRLAKLWVHSHMFSGYLADEIIELLVAHAYTNPRPFEEPHNHVAGFLRFLHLLSTFNWEETALVVDIDGEFDYDDHQHIQATYERLRSLQRAAKERGTKIKETALYISTPSDKYGRLTRHSPTPLIFKRVVAYAQQSYRILRELVENPFTAEAKWRALFVTPLTPYDVLIHLESAVGAKGGASSKYKNLQLPTKQPVYVGLDLVENYLSELRARFGHLALFFHNALEGRVIGVVWKPGTFAPKPFKVLHTEFAVPVSLLPADSPLVKKLNIQASDASNTKSKVPQVVTNIFELLHDFAAMGEGLVRDVQPNL